MSSKKLVLALIGVVALIGIGVAAVVLSKPSDITFDPAQGDTRDYRIGVIAQMREGDDPSSTSSQESLVMQSVMRYRVDAAGPTLKLHVLPRFVQVQDKDGYTLFSSTQAAKLDDTPVPALMKDGFALIMDRNSGHTRLSAVNRDAWNAFKDHIGHAQAQQFEQQLGTPAVTDRIPARVGAQVSVDAFQGMPALTLTVDRVDDDSVSVALERTDDTPTSYTTLGSGYDAVRTRVTAVHGRMRLSRDGGWIESLALISDQDVESQDKSGHIHTTMTMRHVDNPALGSIEDGLDQLGNRATTSVRDGGVKLPLAHSPAETEPLRANKPAPQPFADADARFSIDDKDHALVLTVIQDIAPDAHLGLSALKQLTLRDADGKVLDIPLVLESIGPDFSQGELNTRVRLLPMGWHDAKLDRIASVQARLDYRDPLQPESIELPLADTPTERQDPGAHIRATPTDDGWRLLLNVSEQTFYTYDPSAVYGDLSARLSDKAHDGLTPADLTQLARVDKPGAWIQQILVSGDSDRFPLALYTSAAPPSSHEIHFTSLEQHYSNRELSPPTKRNLVVTPVPEKSSLALDTEPEGADQNRLSLRLPIGVGSACELAADAPAQEGHALVWRPEDQRAPGFGIGQPRTGEHPDSDRWVLMTDDGIRVYFYGIDVTTTLRCPGTPAWQTRELDGERDKPWLVDIDTVVDGEIDADMPAARFFDSHRFLDARGKPLRPMLKHMSADTRLDDWRNEGMSHSVSDYLDDDGRIRFWGDVAAVKSLTFSGTRIEKQWRNHLKDLQ